MREAGRLDCARASDSKSLFYIFDFDIHSVFSNNHSC